MLGADPLAAQRAGGSGPTISATSRPRTTRRRSSTRSATASWTTSPGPEVTRGTGHGDRSRRGRIRRRCSRLLRTDAIRSRAWSAYARLMIRIAGLGTCSARSADCWPFATALRRRSRPARTAVCCGLAGVASAFRIGVVGLTRRGLLDRPAGTVGRWRPAWCWPLALLVAAVHQRRRPAGRTSVAGRADCVVTAVGAQHPQCLGRRAARCAIYRGRTCRGPRAGAPRP